MSFFSFIFQAISNSLTCRHFQFHSDHQAFKWFRSSHKDLFNSHCLACILNIQLTLQPWTSNKWNRQTQPFRLGSTHNSTTRQCLKLVSFHSNCLDSFSIHQKDLHIERKKKRFSNSFKKLFAIKFQPTRENQISLIYYCITQTFL